MLAIQKPSQEQSTLHIILKSLDQVTTMNKFKRINNDFMNMLFYIGTSDMKSDLLTSRII